MTQNIDHRFNEELEILVYNACGGLILSVTNQTDIHSFAYGIEIMILTKLASTLIGSTFDRNTCLDELVVVDTYLSTGFKMVSYA